MKKGTLKYYLSTFAMSYVFVLLLTIVSHSRGAYFVSGNLDFSGNMAREITCFLYKGHTFVYGRFLIDEIGLIVFPIIFTFMFFLIDLLTKLIKGKKKREQEENERKYDEFVDDIGNELNRTHIFNQEDFRHFRENKKFQECLQKLYKIYTDGENEEVNYALVLRKFEKNTVERKAIEFLVVYTEKRRKLKETTSDENKKEEVNE